ncbi:hypothetical protein A6A25_14195 [Saccharothrix sp. CB00851]|nr:hypothetical protein A6A25_14195 [Saccharothrix sp. CB00851]
MTGDKGVPFIRITNIPRRGIQLDHADLVRIEPPSGHERERTRTKLGDVLISITADIGSVAVVDSSTVDGNVSQHIALVRPIKSACDPTWLAYAIKSPAISLQLTSKSYGGTKTGLGLGNIGELQLPHTDLATQERISHSITDAMNSTEAIRDAITRQIHLLKERRQALITAAVAGQIDVTTARGVSTEGVGV